MFREISLIWEIPGNPFLLIPRLIDTAKESSDVLLNSLVTSYPKKVLFTGVAFFSISFTGFAILTSNALINGDAAGYAEQITNFNFSEGTVHLGYYLVGVVFTTLLPGPNDYILNLMNGFLGALSVLLVYLIAFSISGNYRIAIASGLFLVTNYIFEINALYAEVYVVQTFFIILAIYLWLLNKPLFTGISFALAFLVTPSSVFAIPCFVILRPRKRALIQLGVPAFIIIAIALLPHFEDYLFGGGNLQAVRGSSVDLVAALVKEGYEVIVGLFLVIPFVLAGLVHVAREKRLRAIGLAVFSLWLFSLFLGERFRDVPVQLPTYALLSVIGGLGFQFFSDIASAKAHARGDLYLWVLAGSSLIIISVLVIAIRIEITRTIASIPLILPLTFIAIVALHPVIATLSARFANFKNISRFLAVSGVLVLVVGINATLAFSLISKKRHDLIEYRTTVLEMSKVVGPDYLAVGGWNHGVLFEHYLFQKSHTGKWLDTYYLFKDWSKDPLYRSEQAESIKTWQDAKAIDREIWILNHWEPVLSDLRQAGYCIELFRNIYRARKTDLCLTGANLS